MYIALSHWARRNVGAARAFIAIAQISYTIFFFGLGLWLHAQGIMRMGKAWGWLLVGIVSIALVGEQQWRQHKPLYRAMMQGIVVCYMGIALYAGNRAGHEIALAQAGASYQIVPVCVYAKKPIAATAYHLPKGENKLQKWFWKHTGKHLQKFYKKAAPDTPDKPSRGMTVMSWILAGLVIFIIFYLSFVFGCQLICNGYGVIGYIILFGGTLGSLPIAAWILKMAHADVPFWKRLLYAFFILLLIILLIPILGNL